MDNLIINIEHYKKSDIFNLENITFDFVKHNCIGLVGPNGSGKTTTINLLSLQEDYKELNVMINESKVNFNNKNDLKKYLSTIWFMTDESPYFEFLTALEQFNMLDKSNNNKFDYDKFILLCKELDFSKYIDVEIRKLSMGNKKKLQIILCLSSTYPFLVLDEPTNGLDPVMQIKLKKLLNKELENNRKFIISSHNLDLLSDVSDSFIFLNDGKVIKESQNKMSNIDNEKFLMKVYEIDND